MKLRLLAQINSRISAMKSARNTFSNTRKLYNSKVGKSMSTSLFEQGLAQRLMNEGYEFGPALDTASISVHNIKLNRSGQLKTLNKFRKYLASGIQKSFAPIRKQSDLNKYGNKALAADRAVNARAKGVKFIRKNGRIIPIRPKK